MKILVVDGVHFQFLHGRLSFVQFFQADLAQFRAFLEFRDGFFQRQISAFKFFYRRFQFRQGFFKLYVLRGLFRCHILHAFLYYIRCIY